MFLIEDQTKAILYTGDIRAEPWWLNNLTRHPTLLPFTISGPGGRRLDRMYFDTTFATTKDTHRDFPTKADGLRELFVKIAAYPRTTRFYLNAWTFGYEEVWLALSQALKSRVHLDRYRYGMYAALSREREPGISRLESREAPFLCGFKCGNLLQPGCITPDPNVRLHSCEKGSICSVLVKGGKTADDVVEIIPIISRYNGIDIGEAGAGGGKGDLDQTHELNITEDWGAVLQLLALCKERIKDRRVLEKVVKMLKQAWMKQKSLPFDLPKPPKSADGPVKEEETDTPISLSQIVNILSSLAVSAKSDSTNANASSPRRANTIRFPYSRHSSYNELRQLIAAFRPTDVYPCVAPPVSLYNETQMSMQVLFGDCCAENTGIRAWDVDMRAARKAWEEERVARGQASKWAREEEREEEETESEGEDEFATAEEEVLEKLAGVGGFKTVTSVIGKEQPSLMPIKELVPTLTPVTHPLVAGRNDSKPSKPPSPTRTPRPLLTKQETPAGRKRPSTEPLHLSPASRLKVRTDAYNAATQGTWAQAAKLASTNPHAQDSDDEL